MVARVASPGSSFTGIAAYCLHDARLEREPETSDRVEWTDTRNLPTSRGDRAAAVMAATAEAAPDLKRLAGGSAAGRKLAKPVCHYSLNWAQDEEPGREEMTKAVDQSLKALGLEKQHRQDRVVMGKAHGAEARGIEEAGGAAYRRRMEGSEERAEVAVLAGRWKEGGDRYRHGVTDTERRVEWLASEVRLEQVRKVEGEAAYQEQKRDRDKAWDPERWTHSPRPSPDQLRPRGPERDRGGGIER